jgi:hypothetical protein
MAEPPNPPTLPAPAPAPATNWVPLAVAALAGVLLTALLAGGGWLWWWWAHTNPPPDIVLPSAVAALPGRIVEIDVQTTATDLQWDSKNDPGEWDLVLIEAGRKNFFVAPNPGVYTLLLRGIHGGKIVGPFTCTITVGTPGPVPPGPTPPGPTPPVPPGPPAPIPGDGLRVLMVYDTATLGKLPVAQRDVLYSETIRGWLRDHVAKGPDGKSTEWRVLPSNEDLSAESPTWQNAFKRPRASLPWLIISNGKTGYEGPLPGTMADMMSLLQKYATP